MLLRGLFILFLYHQKLSEDADSYYTLDVLTLITNDLNLHIIILLCIRVQCSLVWNYIFLYKYDKNRFKTYSDFM